MTVPGLAQRGPAIPTEHALARAMSAIAVAEQSRRKNVGRNVALETLDWARRVSVTAFGVLLEDEGFWATSTSGRQRPSASRRDLDRAKDIVAAELAIVLTGGGFTPPPHIGEFIAEARRSVELAARSHEPEAVCRAALDNVRTLHESLSRCDLPRGRLRKLLTKAKKTIAAASIGPMLGAGLAGAVVDDVYDTAKLGVVHLVGVSAAPANETGKSELARLRLEQQRAETRRAQAEADKAEVEARRSGSSSRASKPPSSRPR